MIFIVSAIVILIVSFVLAFISLVREQSKFEQNLGLAGEVKEEKDKANVVEKKLNYEGVQDRGQRLSPDQKEGLPVNGKSTDDDIARATQDLGAGDLLVQEEPFPWLPTQGKKGELPKQSQEEQDEMRKIKQRLEAIAQENKKNRLSGEISLSPLRDSGKS